MDRTLHRALLAASLASTLLGFVPAPAHAQDASSTAAITAEYDERFRRLNGYIEELSASQATLMKRISTLSDQIQTARDEASRASSQAQSQLGQFVRYDDLRKLADEIKKIDQRREDDRRLILEEIRKLAQTPVVVPAPEPPKRQRLPDPVPVPVPEPPKQPATPPAKGYEHVVKERETIAAIVAAYQQNGVKVTVSQVLKANPGLNPNRIKVGQKVFIPDPAAQ
jgi:LysM repeat protein/outer membrane murein-binding lipoprotein Lpp